MAHLYNPLNADLTARDIHGLHLNVTGRIDEVCDGPNPVCLAAYDEGRYVHVLPPRYAADGASLVMPSYHFATVADAEAGYTAARKDAVTATSFAHRDELYTRGVPVWVPFDLSA